MLNTDLISDFQDRLLQWFSENKRDLPWRRTSNPYYIWISEVMLQQTQVDTVIPYYEEFISRFPTMHDLARAPQEDVLKRWEGLGYYSRARNLQSGVQEVVEKYNAKIPEEKKELLTVKGVGPYTAGAILSIAYGKPEPAVDGNVMRVLSRIFLIDEDIAKVKTRKTFESLLYELIPEQNASYFNQGLMEIGALICKPKNPLCDGCPLAIHCQARAKGVQTDYPVKKKKIKQKTMNYVAVILRDGHGNLLIHKRANEGLLANFWEFPLIDKQSDVSLIEQANGLSVELKVKGDPQWSLYDETVTHIFSHLKWHINIIVGTIQEANLQVLKDYLWVSEKDIKQYPFPVPHQKIMKIIGVEF